MTLLGARLVCKTTGAIQRQNNFLSAEDFNKVSETAGSLGCRRCLVV